MTSVRRVVRLTLAPILFFVAGFSLCIAYPQDQATPYWAYVLNPPSDPPAPDATPLHVPNSSASFTFAQTQDYFHVADWHLDAHPSMPSIVAVGRKPDVYACAFCHLPNGQGKPENSSLAGLPAAYVIQQMADFKSGVRKSSEPKHVPVATMIAKAAAYSTADEIQSAAAYFASIKPKPWIRVVQTKNVPKTHIDHFMLVPTPNAGREPIGHRVIEMAEHPERTELRDDASSFVAFVPIGSLAKGKSLASTGLNGRTIPCATCHGTELRGLANVPAIAGRSPSYIFRQLFDMQSGARHGPAAVPMQPVVALLTVDDMIAISAYLASLHP
jgi:cytochrome c553